MEEQYIDKLRALAAKQNRRTLTMSALSIPYFSVRNPGWQSSISPSAVRNTIGPLRK